MGSSHTFDSEGKFNHLAPSIQFKNPSNGSTVLFELANIDFVPRIYSNINEKKCSRRTVLQPSQKALSNNTKVLGLFAKSS